MTYLESPYPISYLWYIMSNDLEPILKELEAHFEFDLWDDLDRKVRGQI